MGFCKQCNEFHQPHWCSNNLGYWFGFEQQNLERLTNNTDLETNKTPSKSTNAIWYWMIWWYIWWIQTQPESGRTDDFSGRFRCYRQPGWQPQLLIIHRSEWCFPQFVLIACLFSMFTSHVNAPNFSFVKPLPSCLLQSPDVILADPEAQPERSFESRKFRDIFPASVPWYPPKKETRQVTFYLQHTILAFCIFFLFSSNSPGPNIFSMAEPTAHCWAIGIYGSKSTWLPVHHHQFSWFKT